MGVLISKVRIGTCFHGSICYFSFTFYRFALFVSSTSEVGLTSDLMWFLKFDSGASRDIKLLWRLLAKEGC